MRKRLFEIIELSQGDDRASSLYDSAGYMDALQQERQRKEKEK